MRYQGETKHPTNKSSSFAYERTNNWYYWENKSNEYSIINESFRAMSTDDSGLAPLTIYNDWPKSLKNANIFPYLLTPNNNAKHKEFYKFVQQWYQTSCAIIYDAPHSPCKIIGTGCLTDLAQKGEPDNLIVATARHNFQDIPIERLFVRFFKYDVGIINSNRLKIQESYLDMPIIHVNNAEKGLDAGYLVLPALKNNSLFKQYGKILPINVDSNTQPLSSGNYAMFHFAGAKHQISLGEIEPSMNYNLYDDIVIQAGPGASGAAVIWHSFNKTEGCGISIYRMIKNNSVERRLIAFNEFSNGPRWGGDGIKLPYWKNPSFNIIPTEAFDESGYEFLRYLSEARGLKKRPEHPTNNDFQVAANHSNHHIIPIDDLLYLWDYFHTLDKDTLQGIQKIVAIEAKELYEEKNKAMLKEFKSYPRDEYAYRWNNRHKEIQQIEDEVATFKINRFNEMYKEQVKNLYFEFHLILYSLLSSYDSKNDQANRTWFAWSYWNLFKGWKLDYRYDDPAKKPQGSDFSEKIKPAGYSPRLWKCLKDKPNGLYNQIQELKKLPYSNKHVENAVYGSLKALSNEWSQRRQNEKIIHPYNSQEWEIMGSDDNHPIYRVKPT